MTKEESQNAIKVMQAYINGEKIEYTYINDDKVWYLINLPTWNWDKYKYRIKQKPKYRPFKDAEECWAEMQKHQPFGWVKGKTDGLLYLITAIVSKNDIRVDEVFLSLDCIEESCTFADGLPFGVKVEE